MDGNNTPFRIYNVRLVSAGWDLERISSSPSEVSIKIIFGAGSLDDQGGKRRAFAETETNIIFTSKESGEASGSIKLNHKVYYNVDFDITDTDEPQPEMVLLMKDASIVLAGYIRSDAMLAVQRSGARTPFIITPEEIDSKMANLEGLKKSENNPAANNSKKQ